MPGALACSPPFLKQMSRGTECAQHVVWSYGSTCDCDIQMESKSGLPKHVPVAVFGIFGTSAIDILEVCAESQWRNALKIEDLRGVSSSRHDVPWLVSRWPKGGNPNCLQSRCNACFSFRGALAAGVFPIVVPTSLSFSTAAPLFGVILWALAAGMAPLGWRRSC